MKWLTDTQNDTLKTFHVAGLFLYPRKKSENLWSFMFSGGIERDR